MEKQIRCTSSGMNSIKEREQNENYKEDEDSEGSQTSC